MCITKIMCHVYKSTVKIFLVEFITAKQREQPECDHNIQLHAIDCYRPFCRLNIDRNSCYYDTPFDEL